jgi:hypothetical protein
MLIRFLYPYEYGLFFVRPVFLRIYFDIFKWFNGAPDHLLTRTQFSRRSSENLRSGDIRRFCFRKDSPLNEKNRRRSLSDRLSMNERMFFFIGITSQ